MVPFSIVKGIYIAHWFCPTAVKSGAQKLHLVTNIMRLGQRSISCALSNL